jgi:DNA-directed RNA polymerase specialized sigma24 family protein
MKGILLVQLQLLLTPENREKPELILHKAGFSPQEIAEFLGKTMAAVQKTIQRAQ